MANFISFPPPPPPPQSQDHYLHPPELPRPPPPSAGPTAAAAATLLVRHLPEAIPEDMIARLFAHFGAVSVRPCAGGKLRNCAFVDFKDETLASQAQSQMNRLRFLGKVLSVERVGSSAKDADPRSESEARKDSSGLSTSLSKDPCNRGNSLCDGEPIAPRLGVDYPFPPHLEYEYPPPDGNILTNIVNALIAVPRFYTQVLHLMNKMNLPAPFRMALPTPPLPPTVPAPPPPPVPVEPPRADLSSDESELESSEDDVGDNHNRKRVKREAIVGPAVDKGVAHEAVGLKYVSLVPREVTVIKKKNPVLQIKIAPKPTQKEITDDGTRELTEPIQDQVEQKPYATPEDIEKGKLPPEEILSLPMFKNYAAGHPAMVLYLKNLAKDVVADDFYFIFGSLFENSEAARSGLNIKLMTEGRMRGQAFVTFPSIDLAHRALVINYNKFAVILRGQFLFIDANPCSNGSSSSSSSQDFDFSINVGPMKRSSMNLANGYVFKGKPMIIQFGRNPASAKAT